MKFSNEVIWIRRADAGLMQMFLKHPRDYGETVLTLHQQRKWKCEAYAWDREKWGRFARQPVRRNGKYEDLLVLSIRCSYEPFIWYSMSANSSPETLCNCNWKIFQPMSTWVMRWKWSCFLLFGLAHDALRSLNNLILPPLFHQSASPPASPPRRTAFLFIHLHRKCVSNLK